MGTRTVIAGIFIQIVGIVACSSEKEDKVEQLDQQVERVDTIKSDSVESYKRPVRDEFFYQEVAQYVR